MSEAEEEDIAAPRAPHRWEIAVAVAFAALVNLAVQLKTPGFTDPDGYYHVRWSRILWEGLSHGRLPQFTWLPLTILNPHDYADHHFLFHVAQIPFVLTDDVVLGGKISALVFATLAYTSCYALVARAKVRFGPLWALLLVSGSLTVLARMALPRAPALMLILLVAGVWLLFTERRVWLGVTTFVAVWTYSLFPFLGVFAVFWCAARWIVDRRLEWRPIVATAVGGALGLVINPYFPNNVRLLLEHLWQVSPLETVEQGTEWAPIGMAGLLVLSAVGTAAHALGLAIVVRRRRRAGAETIFLCLASTFLLALTLRSVRFAEYWAPFAVVFLAYAAKPILDTWRPVTARVAAAAVALLVAPYLATFVATTDVSAIPSTHPDVYRAAGEWLAANTPEGSLVYNVAYEDFPAAFCFDTHNTYVNGLSPTYIAYEHPDLGRLYADVEAGRVPLPGAVIRDRFGARYVLVNISSQPFLTVARADPSIRLAYSNPYVAVLEIAEGPAPATTTPPASGAAP